MILMGPLSEWHLRMSLSKLAEALRRDAIQIHRDDFRTLSDDLTRYFAVGKSVDKVVLTPYRLEPLAVTEVDGVKHDRTAAVVRFNQTESDLFLSPWHRPVVAIQSPLRNGLGSTYGAAIYMSRGLPKSLANRVTELYLVRR